MAGIAGRTGKRTVKSIQRQVQQRIETKAPEIMDAYISKGLNGDSAILIDLANRLGGKVKSVTELDVTGLDFNVNALFVAYRDAQQALLDKVQVKQLAENNEPSKDNVLEGL